MQDAASTYDADDDREEQGNDQQTRDFMPDSDEDE
jgi:hypothetical protein